MSGCSGVYSRTVGYGYFRAFNRMLNNLDLFKQVVRNAMGRTKTEITKGEEVNLTVDLVTDGRDVRVV